MQKAPLDADRWINRIYYGGDLDREAERLLHLTAYHYQDSDKAENFLRQAKARAGNHLAVAIGAYKFYFYKGRKKEALAAAQQCLDLVAEKLHLPDWQSVSPKDAEFASFDHGLERLYLFILKAMAYLYLRLGEAEKGKAMLAKLRELDPHDKIESRFLLRVLEQEDDD
jgi:tetratricopeptide (TPR) repeat protein